MDTPLITRLLLAASLALAAIGVGLVVTQPGGLGGSDEVASESTTTFGPTSSTVAGATSTVPGDTTPGDTAPGATVPGATASTTAGGAGDTTPPATSPPPPPAPTTAAPTTTAAPSGSGMGSGGAAPPPDTANGLPDTGGENLLLAAGLLALVALALRPRAAPPAGVEPAT